NDEKIDAIADAADKSDGAAAEDEQLIADIEEAPVDQAGDIVRKWLNSHADPDKTETKHQKQRRLRGMKRFETKDGLEALLATGDRSSIDEIWNLLNQDADAAYRAAGGRDVPGGKHATTPLQRLYDAFVGRITGGVENEDGDQKPSARADTGRPTVFASLTLDPDTGEVSRAELAGGGPLPQSVLDRIMCNADIIAAAFDQTGEILWQGRKVRTTTAAQYKALIARDGGCVLCGAHYLLCEAHHLLPWNAPDKGKTNVDEMALLCQSCHHYVHDNNLTLVRAGPAPPGERKPTNNRAKVTDPNRSKTKAAQPGTESAAPPGGEKPADRPRITWQTRPATALETPPPRPGVK
ncbi:MAG: HNH endonuclease, partial [Acidimicrobiales bacterium]|nr:HNH endonuclease [Acidimicrobiales bacterium]